MVTIVQAEFVRMGYSGGDRFGEVEVSVEGFEHPLVATFKREQNGTFTLVNVTERREDLDLDWFENNLHDANPSMMNRLFGSESDGSVTRRSFEEQILRFGNVRETLEDAMYYGSGG